MKFYSFGVIAIALLFPLNSNGQSYSKEQLKNIELQVVTIQVDTTSFIFEKPRLENVHDLMAYHAVQAVDSILAYVQQKKLDRLATFEGEIVPFIEIKCNELNFTNLIFDENEVLVYDSFLHVLEWNKTIETVNLYEDFIKKNSESPEKSDAILTVLSFIKQLYFFIKSKKNSQSEWLVYRCITQNFEANNEVDWKVFALNPCKLFFWTVASCAWDSRTEH